MVGTAKGTGLVLGMLGGLAAGRLLRRWHRHWGATAAEVAAPLAGDDLVPCARYVTTRAVTVRTPPEAVWPWLVQLGQGRGGFYTYDRLEQWFGAAIRNADRVVPELQNLAVGDVVRLSPAGGPTVARLEPARALVLHGTMDLRTSQSIPSGTGALWALEWSWAFVLQPGRDGGTRLLVRSRADYKPRVLLAPAVALLLEPAHFVMERGMVLGIKRRAERAGGAPATADGSPPAPATVHVFAAEPGR